MTTPNPGDPGNWNPPAGPPQWSPPPPVPYPGYAAPGYAVDPSAPYGRDPATGLPLSDKSAAAAGCLQLFLGMFGAGRFYINSLPIAFVQLGLTIFGFISAFFLVGIFILMGVGVWVFVDAIMMFTGSVKDEHGRKLR